MLKHDLYHIAKTKLSEHSKTFLLDYFTEQEVDEFERQGGRIQVALMPLKSRHSQEPKRVILSDNDINGQLQAFKGSVEQLKSLLDELPIAKLKAVAKSLKIPLRSGASANEIKANLISSLQYKDNWQSISGGKERQDS